ncbi:hypothetical protein H0H92_003155 [Tricholoma furcatifolium]|nr:hypothetical protein H0H92_003155 [Tricholoma furcatifolium]
MYHLPTELYQEIFNFACVDDGATGRSLSQTSRYFRQVSQRSKLQSVALVGAQQLRDFADHLAELPPTARRVRHLCISLVLETLPKTSHHRHVVDEGTSSFWEHEETTSAALLRILQYVSSSLLTLHLISNARRTSILPPISLPLLQSLTMHGPMRVGSRISDDLPAFPSLRDLSLRLFQEYPTTTLRQVCRQAPSLQHLSFSLERPLPDLSRDFTRALEQKTESGNPSLGLPASMTRICVQHIVGSVIDKNMWLRSAQKEMLKELSEMIAKDKRVSVAATCQLPDYQEARQRWLAAETV